MIRPTGACWASPVYRTWQASKQHIYLGIISLLFSDCPAFWHLLFQNFILYRQSQIKKKTPILFYLILGQTFLCLCENTQNTFMSISLLRTGVSQGPFDYGNYCRSYFGFRTAKLPLQRSSNNKYHITNQVCVCWKNHWTHAITVHSIVH